MKKLLFVLLAVITVYSCQKKDGPTVPQEVEVEFVIQQTDFGGLKSTNDDVPQCSTDSWDYVEFVLNGTTYYSPIIPVSGDLYTMAFKLPSGTAGMNYLLDKFLVKHDKTSDGPSVDDNIVMAAPEPLALYHSLMMNPLNMNIFIEGFIKKEIVIDVLCFEDLYYEAFGFTWFKINEVIIERQCFFGDICVPEIAPWLNSLYSTQTQGVRMDMPSIMKIEVFKFDVDPLVNDWVLENTFRNDLPIPLEGLWATPGEGNCLEVFWANDMDLTEDFRFDLYVMGPDDSWTFITEYTFQDDDCPTIGETDINHPDYDGVVDFVISTVQGECHDTTPDYWYPFPW